MPTARTAARAAVLDGKIYVVGGDDDEPLATVTWGLVARTDTPVRTREPAGSLDQFE